MVREEFTLNQAVRQLEWSQRLPATCYPRKTDPERLRRIGLPRGIAQLDSLSYAASHLDPGLQIHEYVLTAVRPGTCLLPPPQVRIAGTELAVNVEPVELRITVSESQ